MEIKELVQSYQQLSGKEVTFSGWIRNKRVGKNVSFLMVNDGTCFETVQVVFKDMKNQEALEKLQQTNIVQEYFNEFYQNFGRFDRAVLKAIKEKSL